MSLSYGLCHILSMFLTKFHGNLFNLSMCHNWCEVKTLLWFLSYMCLVHVSCSIGSVVHYLVIKEFTICVLVIKVASRYDKFRYYHLCVYNVREFYCIFLMVIIWWVVHTSWNLVCRMYHPLHPFWLCSLKSKHFFWYDNINSLYWAHSFRQGLLIYSLLAWQTPSCQIWLQDKYKSKNNFNILFLYFWLLT